MTPHARIDRDLEEFLESGLSIVVGTRDAALRADGAVAWAVRVHGGEGRLVLFMHPLAADEMLVNLRQHAGIAICFDRPTSHRACQVKGTFLGSRPARSTERELVELQLAGFSRELESVGIPPVAVTYLETWPCVALEVEVAQVFEQTPGPGTGGPLR